MIQIESARDPFTSPRIAFQAVTALRRADAMGLLPADERIETLDLPSFRKVVRHIHRAGIARNIRLELGDDLTNSGPGLERILEHLNIALEESPVPEFEWNRLTEVLGLELLSRLLGISSSSVRRYRAAARTTPDDVADRLHFLSLIVGDLSGAYNEIGIRQWFARNRAQLHGRTPWDWLKAGWKPAQPEPRLRLDWLPTGFETVQGRAPVQLCALPREPLPDADFIVGSTEIAHYQAQKVQSVRNIVRGGSCGRPVSANAARRNAEQSGQQFQAEHFRQAIPFELRHWRLLEGDVEVLENPLKSWARIREVIPEFQLDVPGDARPVNMADNPPEGR